MESQGSNSAGNKGFLRTVSCPRRCRFESKIPDLSRWVRVVILWRRYTLIKNSRPIESDAEAKKKLTKKKWIRWGRWQFWLSCSNATLCMVIITRIFPLTGCFFILCQCTTLYYVESCCFPYCFSLKLFLLRYWFNNSLYLYAVTVYLYFTFTG